MRALIRTRYYTLRSVPSAEDQWASCEHGLRTSHLHFPSAECQIGARSSGFNTCHFQNLCHCGTGCLPINWHPIGRFITMNFAAQRFSAQRQETLFGVIHATLHGSQGGFPELLRWFGRCVSIPCLGISASTSSPFSSKGTPSTCIR